MSDQYGYVYMEYNTTSKEKAITLENNSEYFDIQKGSPCIITLSGFTTIYPSWQLIQNGEIIGTAKFNLTLADNQQLIVSSYPENQYARVYNPDKTFADVSQLEDFSKDNYLRVPSGVSTLLAYVDSTTDVSVTFKEERLLV